jgi:D-sedoheptulose 7-phosphate isomerase
VVVSLAERIKKARRVYICGNGGSYANAIHIQNDLEAVGVRAHTLNPASYSASANDHGHEYVFSRWIMLHGEPGDLLIALSGSGTSENILNAIKAAHLIGMDVHLETDYLRTMDMQRSEEKQLEVFHDVMKWLRSQTA